MIPQHWDKIENNINYALDGISICNATAVDVREQCYLCMAYGNYRSWIRFNKRFPEDNLIHTHRGGIIKEGDRIVRASQSHIRWQTYHVKCAEKMLEKLKGRIHAEITKLEYNLLLEK